MLKILITGATHGIGRAIVNKLAAPDTYIWVNAHRSQTELLELCEELSSQGYSCKPMQTDVSDAGEVREMMRWIGGVDILVNNAGMSYTGLLQDMSEEDWDLVMRTNLYSMYYCCKAAIPRMVKQKSGRIINISSVWGEVGASCEAAYAASKGAVNALTKSLAKELAPSGITVNAVAPGVIDTRMNDCYNAQEKEALKQEIAFGRFGETEEVAELVYWLARTAPDYLTGQIISIDGGFL